MSNAKTNSKKYKNTNKAKGFNAKSKVNADDKKPSQQGPSIPETNDPSWYNNDQLLDKASKVNFCNALGDKFDLSGSTYARFDDARMPGIITLSLYSGIGYSKDNTDAVNIAAQEMYTKVRNVQSSAAKYGKQDLMMYYLTVQQALNLYWNGIRALGITNYINRVNRYMPWHFSQALGFDLHNIASNTNRFANVLNKFAKQIAAYAIPAGFHFAERQKFLFSRIFAEGIDFKSKYYLVRPAGYFKFKLDSESKGMLEWNTLTYSDDTLFTVDTYAELLDTIVNSFVGDEDFGTMSGDIMKTFPNHLVGWEPVDINFTIEPYVDYNFLVAFHNATVMPPVKSGNITQDAGLNRDFILCDPRFGAQEALIASKVEPRLGKRILDMPDGFPTDSNGVVEATRFTCIPVATGSAEFGFNASTPVDIATGCAIYILEDDDTGAAKVATYTLSYTTDAWGTPTEVWSTTYERVVGRLYPHVLASEFRFSPLSFLLINQESGSTVIKSKALLMNTVHNYAIVDKQLLDDLNSVCTMSLFSTKNL